jgi:hypothetical protein
MNAYWHRQWTEMLAAGREEGSLRPDIDPAAAATMVIGALTASHRLTDDPIGQFEAVTVELERALKSASPETRTST